MIHLLSGLPGSGKSLRAVWMIQNWLKEGREVFVCGIDGINVPGVHPLDDPLKWESLPDGSVVVVDEAQKHGRFPTRRGDIHPAVLALSEHRHHGFDFLIITQDPGMLDVHVRRLVGQHEHLLRRFGLSASKIFSWSECQDDPKQVSARSAAEQQTWFYPKECYSLYKSASMHTMKRRIPKAAYFLLFAAFAVPALLWKAYSGAENMKTNAVVEDAKNQIPIMDQDADGQIQADRPRDDRIVGKVTPAKWAERWIPRVDGIPWSAPAYDDERHVTIPKLYCMRSGYLGRDRCRCYTQQVTRVRVSKGVCEAIVRDGVFNPFLADEEIVGSSIASYSSASPGAQQAGIPGQDGPGGAVPVEFIPAAMPTEARAAPQSSSSGRPYIGSHYVPPSDAAHPSHQFTQSMFGGSSGGNGGRPGWDGR